MRKFLGILFIVLSFCISSQTIFQKSYDLGSGAEITKKNNKHTRWIHYDWLF